jgi:hypothetical protein
LENKGIENLEDFKNRLNGLKEISLFSNYITYPLLSKILEIPYRHLLTLSVANSYLLNLLLYDLLSDEFKKKYPTMVKMLLYYNKMKPILKTTYKIKDISTFVETASTFLGFKSMNNAYDLYSGICGKISRNSYSTVTDHQEVLNFPLAKLEVDMIKFYNLYFGEQLEPLYNELRNKIDRML